MGEFSMPVNIPRGASDPVINELIAALERYQEDHPQAMIDLYRQNPVSVRVRIVDPDFAEKSKSQRSRETWKYLENLPNEAQSDISTLLLLAPDERAASFANLEFDAPVPSRL
jgi:hypothetical protein